MRWSYWTSGEPSPHSLGCPKYQVSFPHLPGSSKHQVSFPHSLESPKHKESFSFTFWEPPHIRWAFLPIHWGPPNIRWAFSPTHWRPLPLALIKHLHMKLTLQRESLYFCVLHLNLLHSILQIHIVEKQTNKHKTFPFPLSRGHCSPIWHYAPAVAAVQSEVPVEYTIGLLARYGRRPSSFPLSLEGGGS